MHRARCSIVSTLFLQRVCERGGLTGNSASEEAELVLFCYVDREWEIICVSVFVARPAFSDFQCDPNIVIIFLSDGTWNLQYHNDGQCTQIQLRGEGC